MSTTTHNTKKHIRRSSGTSASSTTGFALFYAVLVASLVLTIAIATATVTFKQGRLVSGVLSSQDAFYAADSGLECALYWDIQQNVFSGIAESPVITCNGGEDITASKTASNTWEFSLTGNGIHCANVEIDKSEGETTIESRGYNTCDTSDDRRVERGVRATY